MAEDDDIFNANIKSARPPWRGVSAQRVNRSIVSSLVCLSPPCSCFDSEKQEKIIRGQWSPAATVKIFCLLFESNENHLGVPSGTMEWNLHLLLSAFFSNLLQKIRQCVFFFSFILPPALSLRSQHSVAASAAAVNDLCLAVLPLINVLNSLSSSVSTRVDKSDQFNPGTRTAAFLWTNPKEMTRIKK